MRATSETRMRLILAFTALMAPLALWGLTGYIDSLSRRRRRYSNFTDPAQIEGFKAFALRDKAIAAGVAGKWQRVVEIIDENFGDDVPTSFAALRAEANWYLGKRQTAIRGWEVSLDPNEEPTRAAVLALSGDVEGYRKYCEELLARPTVEGVAANNRAWALVLLPAGVKDYKPVLALAEKGVAAAKRPSDRAIYLNTLGAAHLRAGHYQKAIDVLLESEKLQKMAANWPLLALGYRKTDKARVAASWEDRFKRHLRSTFGDVDRSRHELFLFEQELKSREKTSE